MDIQLFKSVVQWLGRIQVYSALEMVIWDGNCHAFFSTGRQT